MALVFKRGGKRAKGYWYASWHDHNGQRRTQCTKTKDKATAERIGRKKEADAALRRDGVIDTVQERFSMECCKPLSEHVADYRDGLVAKANTQKHVEMTDFRVRYVTEQCGASQVKHLTASAVRGVIKSIRDNGRSLETCNSYLRAIKGFSRWMWRDKRTPDDALTTLEAYNTATDDPRHERRELTVAEILWLLPFVEGHTLPTHNLTGPDQAICYRLALGTSFRAKELRSLIPDSFALDSDPPTITVHAGSSKRRRTDVQPIHGDLAAILRPWLATKRNGTRLFARWNGPDASSGSCGSPEGMDRRGWVRPRKTIEGDVRFPEIPELSGPCRGFPRHPTHVYQ